MPVLDRFSAPPSITFCSVSRMPVLGKSSKQTAAPSFRAVVLQVRDDADTGRKGTAPIAPRLRYGPVCAPAGSRCSCNEQSTWVDCLCPMSARRTFGHREYPDRRLVVKRQTSATLPKHASRLHRFQVSHSGHRGLKRGLRDGMQMHNFAIVEFPVTWPHRPVDSEPPQTEHA